MTPILLLASNSPRRRELLALTGLDFSVQPVNIDESPYPGEDPQAYVLRLAETKARTAVQFTQPGQRVLAADTTVAHGLQILGKPSGAEEARQMLHDLRGTEHSVYTAISVTDHQGKHLITDLCATRVWMRNYSEPELEEYIASGDPFDKAGGYAIQHEGFHPVERIEGCYACVVGLPLCHVIRALEQFGVIAPLLSDQCPAEVALDSDSPCPEIEKLLRAKPDGARHP